jgi:dihydrofolate reductase
MWNEMETEMAKVVLFIAASLDGKIARKDGSLDWLHGVPNPNKSDFGYARFLSTVGTLFLGRKTYEEILGFGVEWPYAGKTSYVVTSDANYRPVTDGTFCLKLDLATCVRDLRASSDQDIWLVGGSQLIATFMEFELVDRIIVTLIPVTLGEGIPLFPAHAKDVNWALREVERFDSGVLGLTYDKAEVR